MVSSDCLTGNSSQTYQRNILWVKFYVQRLNIYNTVEDVDREKKEPKGLASHIFMAEPCSCRGQRKNRFWFTSQASASGTLRNTIASMTTLSTRAKEVFCAWWTTFFGSTLQPAVFAFLFLSTELSANQNATATTKQMISSTLSLYKNDARDQTACWVGAANDGSSARSGL